jgi:hypothetical protein
MVHQEQVFLMHHCLISYMDAVIAYLKAVR